MHHLRTLVICASSFLGIVVSPGIACAQSQAQAVATIKQLEVRWSNAEATGDSAFLEQLLMPDYRSVGVKGTWAGKAAIIAGAMRPKSAAMRQMIETYAAVHHIGTSITIHGNMAIVTFYSQKLGEKRGVTSSDFFVDDNGQWRAIYSAHTSVKA